MDESYFNYRELLHYLPTLTAFLAVIIGAWVALITAKRQLRGQIIYAQNYNDINLFRDALNDFLTEYAKFSILFNERNFKLLSEEQFAIRYAASYDKMLYQRNKMTLLLHPQQNQLHLEFAPKPSTTKISPARSPPL